jgi:hypothetical protein
MRRSSRALCFSRIVRSMSTCGPIGALPSIFREADVALPSGNWSSIQLERVQAGEGRSRSSGIGRAAASALKTRRRSRRIAKCHRSYHGDVINSLAVEDRHCPAWRAHSSAVAIEGGP